jgi:hypothetical protein
LIGFNAVTSICALGLFSVTTCTFGSQEWFMQLWKTKRPLPADFVNFEGIISRKQI